VGNDGTQNASEDRAAGLIATAALADAAGLRPEKYRFGFSQATILETWRVRFNKDMRKEADKHPRARADHRRRPEQDESRSPTSRTHHPGVDVLSHLAEGIGPG